MPENNSRNCIQLCNFPHKKFLKTFTAPGFFDIIEIGTVISYAVFGFQPFEVLHHLRRRFSFVAGYLEFRNVFFAVSMHILLLTIWIK